jgi:hypothetical protein
MDLHPFTKPASGKRLRVSRFFPVSSVHPLKLFLLAALLLPILAACAPKYFTPVSGETLPRKDLRELSGGGGTRQ